MACNNNSSTTTTPPVARWWALRWLSEREQAEQHIGEKHGIHGQVDKGEGDHSVHAAVVAVPCEGAVEEREPERDGDHLLLWRVLLLWDAMVITWPRGRHVSAEAWMPRGRVVTE